MASGQSTITKDEIMQIWSSLTQTSGDGSHKVPCSIFSLQSLLFCFPSMVPRALGDVPYGSELLLYHFSLIKASRTAQIFVLKFSKDGSADPGDEFTDGGSANQRVILQGGVGLSCCQVSQHYCQVKSHF